MGGEEELEDQVNTGNVHQEEEAQEERIIKEERREENLVARQSVRNNSVPQVQAPRRATVGPATARPLLNQAVTNQASSVPRKSPSKFTWATFQEVSGKKIEDLSADYQRLGTLLDEYGSMLNAGKNLSEQGRNCMQSWIRSVSLLYNISEQRKNRT